VPVTCTSIFATQEDARAIPCGELDLCVCPRCGFAFNRLFDARLGELGARYESSQAASARFNTFATSLAADWVTRYNLKDRTVVEVGSGGGDFLRLLLDTGVARACGVDPLGIPSSDPRLQTRPAVFDPTQHDYDASALVCRHTLEHVPDVANFLRDIRQWAGATPNRVVLFEFPDAERVFAERAFWDVYYEHCNYFTMSTARAAFEHAGLEILRMYRAYGDQYLIVEARAGNQVHPQTSTAEAAVIACQEFARDVRFSVERCGAALQQMAASSRVVIWQGAAKTVGLFTFLGDVTSIECAIDLNPQRQGGFLPGTGVHVLAPQALQKIRPEHVVLMNPIYLDEVRAAVHEMRLASRVHSINELLRVV